MPVMSFAHLKKKKAPEKEKAAVSLLPTPPPPVSKPSGGVMSFAHLKGNKQPIAEQPIAKPIKQGQVLSFAHMKLKTKQPVIIHEKKDDSKRRIFLIPAVMETERLMVVNYCEGCGRFLKAMDAEKTIGNQYGRCLRSGEIDSDLMEVWKIIPVKATVARCYFLINKGTKI